MKLRAAVMALSLLGMPVAGAECRQALAIGLDVSGSVDRRDYALQIGGLAWALDDPEVRAAFLQSPEAPVALAIFDWSGAWDQRLILPWTDITGPGVLGAIAARLRVLPRFDGSHSTAVGSAMVYGDLLLAARAGCRRLTLDLAGDGINNTGPRPGNVAVGAGGRVVTVNALVIGRAGDAAKPSPDPGIAELSAWFTAEVIRGPDAFVEVALGFEDFAEAMRRKLLRELAGLFAGGAAAGGDGRG